MTRACRGKIGEIEIVTPKRGVARQDVPTNPFSSALMRRRKTPAPDSTRINNQALRFNMDAGIYSLKFRSPLFIPR
jgi:hypothetical protein